MSVTKRLIALYKKYHTQIGISIKKQKKLWEILVESLNKEFNLKLTPSQGENKWRTLLRAYKTVIDNNNKTGRARKTFEYQAELDDIFGKKKNIYPQILLSDETVVDIPKSIRTSAGAGNPTTDIEPEKYVFETAPTSTKTPTVNQEAESKIYTKKRRISSRNDILEKIRLDRQRQHEEIMKKMEERQQIEREKLIERKKHNQLQEQRNIILREYLESNIPLPPISKNL